MHFRDLPFLLAQYAILRLLNSRIVFMVSLVFTQNLFFLEFDVEMKLS